MVSWYRLDMIRLSAERYHPDQPYSDRYPYVITTDKPVSLVYDACEALKAAGLRGIVLEPPHEAETVIVHCYSYEMALAVWDSLSSWNDKVPT